MTGKHRAETASRPALIERLGRLRDLPMAGTYSTGDKSLTGFYIPALAASFRYDRMAGYYSSSVLQVTARGMVPFLHNAVDHDGGMRLIVGTQLSPTDVAAVRAGAKARNEAIRDAAQAADITTTGDPVGDQYLQALGWMVREGLLQIKVGIPIDTEGNPLEPAQARGYFHSKYGILTDTAGDKVAFIGSENESASGWLYNHETFTVAKSWLAEVWSEQGVGIEARFDKHWNGHPDSGWAVMNLADVDDRLLKLCPPDYTPPVADPIWKFLAPEPEPDLVAAREDLIALRDAPARSQWTAVGTAPATPLPHQSRLVERVVETYPRGYLFADEVGLGKTIEAGLVLRELFLSGAAKRVLLLVPATVMRQWQEELSEKIGLDVSRYDKGTFFDRNNEQVDWDGGNPWSAFPIVLASSHLARRKSRRKEILAAGPWDVVLVDESHHARRRGSKATDTPNSLLQLLQSMHHEASWKALYLASATPMQMNAHEAWDLIELLDLPGLWGQGATEFISYFNNLRRPPKERSWPFLCHMLRDYFTDPQASRDETLEARALTELGFASSRKVTDLHNKSMPPETVDNLTDTEVDLIDQWLRRHTPMKDRVFRNTRETMRAYQAAGILPPEVTVPYRHVTDDFIELGDDEQELYDRIETYIRRHYNAYKTDKKQTLGFIMTIYRRRLTSSFEAIRRSLNKRLEVLEEGKSLADLLTEDDQYDVEDELFDPEEFEISTALLQDEITELRSFLHELGKITGEDTKASRLTSHLQEALHTYDSVVVFTQYTDTLDYVRARVVAAGLNRVGCYSGRGGEVYNSDTGGWDPATKTEIKELFRTGKLTVLLGTDSMSEGLNLQTSGRLINYDMPWNLMRVEQRIGRVDRIGSSYQNIEITNYFYAGTVEQRVYEGIKEDYGDFTDIVGNAQPVLAEVENIIQEHAMIDDKDLGKSVQKVLTQAAEVQSAPVQNTDLGGPAEMVPPPILEGEVTLNVLRERLMSNPLTANHFKPAEATDVYTLTVEGQQHRVTFDREVADHATDGTALLTYGSSLLTCLISDALAG
ncbi:DEAD/DEAH box helicase family protein [Georgenia sp. EYE_87]|uniref:SNF2-related protein n=1 Tax=Georgenia sp. EYE_87 TaxID=2853448 RepID=UPI00200655F2|nr:SNF2-related protein [Georgenia sp. EYE_87]MCK6210514.1 DEAD/DEAH box helicase family protein [Georgenia sp. EYE_87]